MDSGGGNTGSSDPAKTSTVETATNSLPGCGCSSANNITVRVTPTTGGQFDLQVAKTESVENFKKLISKKLKVPKERICLLHRDRQLREGTLQENQLMDGSRLTLLPSVETGLLAQRPEQSVMQALESLNDTQVNDFLSGKAPLNLTMRLGDHMMLIQLQLSTVTPSSSRRSSGGTSSSSSTTATSSSTTSTSSTSAPAAATSSTTTSAATPTPSPSAATSFTASPSASASLSKSVQYAGGAGLPAQLSPALAAPSLSSVIASSPSLSSVIAAAAASAAASAAAAAAAASGSSSAGGSNGMGDPMMTNSRTAPPPSIPSSSGFAKAPVAAASPRSSSFTTATTTSVAECASVHQPASPAPCPAAAASPHPSPLKFLEEAASFLPKVTSSTDCPTAASTSSPSFTSSSSSSSSTSAATVASTSSSLSCPSSSSSPSSSFHTAQPSTSTSTPPSSPPTPSPSASPSSASTTTAAAAATAAGASTTHACGYGNGGSGCKCETPAAKPMLDTRALAEASRNLTQTLKQLSSEVLTSRSDATEDSPRGGRRQGAIIESMHHHGKGVYSGTFSGTLNPALQDRYGRPKRDISTIIHILNDLLCATPQYRRHTRQGHSISVEATGSTVPKKGTNTSDKNSSSLEYMEESGSLSRENQATRGKMEHLRLIMEERRARRRARREARAAPYTTQWSAKSESLPQSSAMGHDTVEPMETGEQSSSTASSEQQLCELNPPEPVVA